MVKKLGRAKVTKSIKTKLIFVYEEIKYIIIILYYFMITV